MERERKKSRTVRGGCDKDRKSAAMQVTVAKVPVLSRN